VADAVIGIVEGDRYRFSGLTTGVGIAPVWLPAGDQRAVESAQRRIRACLSVDFALRGASAGAGRDQLFLVYVAECASAKDAAALTAAAVPASTSDTAELAVSHDRLCAVVIARSTVHGRAAVETAASLRWLSGPLGQALARAAG
jgi:hypothetical protein